MTLLYTGTIRDEAPQDDGDVRTTITFVDNESPTPEAERRPEFNDVERDPDTEGGLTTRSVSDYVVGSEQAPPLPSGSGSDYSRSVDDQISSAGRAPSIEQSGEWGHGSMRWSDATEPTIREGGQFDDTYFSATRPPIQDGTMDMMVPARRPDDGTAEDVQRSSAAAARKAAESSMYQTFLDGMTR